MYVCMCVCMYVTCLSSHHALQLCLAAHICMWLQMAVVFARLPVCLCKFPMDWGLLCEAALCACVCVSLTQHLSVSACPGEGRVCICIRVFTWNLSVSPGIRDLGA